MTEIEQTLEGKVAVVTGGSQGIGKAVVDALIARGARVVIGNRSQALGESVVQELNTAAGFKVAAFIRTDVSSYKDNAALFQLAEKEFGGVDIAFLNAGVGGLASDGIFTPLDDETDELCVNVNSLGVMKGTKIAILHMAKRGGGVIVNMSSIMGTHTVPSLASYCASKHAIVGWTRSMSMLPLVCNIRCNAVLPGFCETEFINMTPELKAVGGPVTELIEHIPKVSIETVVKATLMLIEDETRNAQTLLALPGDEIREEAPAPELTDGYTPEFLEKYQKYITDYPVFYKQVLEYSQKVYAEKYPPQEE
ncbi:hypothetical protein BJV82DRAFT_606190 [Fennellomyces sp. T-0311]|nr:hypothetical protein BJV82DRAFT_606190 [Fennellomyces sp. T-0311]